MDFTVEIIILIPSEHVPCLVLLVFPASVWVGESSAVWRTQWWAEPRWLKFTDWLQAPSTSRKSPLPLSAETLPVKPMVQVQSYALRALVSILPDTMCQTLCWPPDPEGPPARVTCRRKHRGSLSRETAHNPGIPGCFRAAYVSSQRERVNQSEVIPKASFCSEKPRNPAYCHLSNQAISE